jgi:hypothetical protein
VGSRVEVVVGGILKSFIVLIGEKAKLRRVVPVNGLVKRAVPVVVLPVLPLIEIISISPLCALGYVE